jgi:WD40 repeat protein
MIEIELRVDGNEVLASAFGSHSERPRPHSLGVEITPEKLELFAKKVGGAVRKGTALDAALVAEAQQLHGALFQGELRDVVTALTADPAAGALLVRLMLREPQLQKVPWEALCRPGTSEGFLAAGTDLLVARGVSSPEPCGPREVEGAIRVLAVAPGGEATLQTLKDALETSIHDGTLAWLEPVSGERTAASRLFEQLRAGPKPHVVHFLGHGGVDGEGHPTLRLADDEDGEEVWIKAETLALECQASLGAELRLVVLEACEGARPGLLGSAAEILARSGAGAVVAYLWPVRADVARACSAAFYRALTAAERTRGNVIASLSAARRTLLADSAEGFSPVLYLRGSEPVIFHFKEHPRPPGLDGAAIPPERPQLIVPFHQDPRFVGRDKELAQLRAMLLEGPEPSVAGICGMGGVGKSQLAVELAYRQRDAFPGGVYWVNAAKSWQDELAALAGKVGLHPDIAPGSDRQKQLASAFASYLAGHPGALVIFDNLLDPLELQNSSLDIVPTRLACRLLFTTRRREPAFPMIELSGLAEPDALRLLLSTPARRQLLEDKPLNELKTATEICRTLGCLPLAIALASAYLDKHPRIALAGYLSGLVKQGALLVTDAAGVDARLLPTQHEKAVRATLQEQWSALGAGGEGPRVLQTAALLGEAAQVPRARLSLLTGLSDEPDGWRAAPLEEALQELAGLFLVESLTEREIRLHPLVREFAEKQIEGREAFAATCAERLGEALRDMGRLHAEVAARGIDAVLVDLTIGGKLAGAPGRARIERLLRPLDRESHCLRGWDPAKAPGYLLQQVRNRCLELGMTDVQEQAEARLGEQPWPWLRERFPTSRESEALVRTLEGHTGYVSQVALSPDGRLAVSASWDTTLKVWDLETGQVVRTLEGHTSWVNGVALSATGRFAVSSSMDTTLKVWDLETGQVVRTLAGHSDVVCNVALSSDDRIAVSTSADGTLKVWEVATGRVVRTLEGHTGQVISLALTADGRFAVSSSADTTLKVWDLETGQAVCAFKGHTGNVFGVALTADGRFAVSGSADTTLKVWRLGAGTAARALRGHTGALNAVALAADGRHAVSASEDRTLKVWDLATGGVVLTLEGHEDAVNGVALTPDGRFAVSASEDRTLKVWDLATGKAARTFEGHTHSVKGVAIAPDGRFAVSASWDNTLRVWDLATGQTARTLEGHSDSVNSAAMTADGRLAVSASVDSTLRLWNLETGQSVRTFHGHTGSVRNAAMTADGRFAVSASVDNTLQVWDLESGQLLRALNKKPYDARCVALSPDGRFAVSTSMAKTLDVWSLATGDLLLSLETHAALYCCAIAPDGKTLVAGDDAGALHILDWRAAGARAGNVSAAPGSP